MLTLAADYIFDCKQVRKMGENTYAEQLLPQVAVGNEVAYDTLFRRYYAPMVLYADSRLHDREESEDIVTDLFCALWQKKQSLSDVRSDKDYLFILLRNRLVDHLRRGQSFRREELTDVYQDEPLEDTIFEVELYARLKEEIDRLPVKCAEVMRLKLEGWDDKEIAQLMNIGYETVRTHTKRGISLLRKKFSDTLLLILFA